MKEQVKKKRLKNYNSALKRLKNIKKSSYERFSVPIIEAWLISEEKKNLKKAKQKLDELETDLVINGLRNLNLALIHELFNNKTAFLLFPRISKFLAFLILACQ